MALTVSERIEKLIQQLKISQKQLAELAGLSENTISNAKKGKNIPSLDFFNAIYKAIPDLNPSWLCMGEGEMFSNKYTDNFRAEINDNSSGKILSGDDYKKMILILETEIQYLRLQLKDKEEIIQLLKSRMSGQ